jgi:hypothetical protein
LERKDHLYQPKSKKRINQEINNLLSSPGFSSGNSIQESIYEYVLSLRFDEEKKEAQELFRYLSEESDNPNVRRLMKKLTLP